LDPGAGKTWPNVSGDSANEVTIESISNIESKIITFLFSIFTLFFLSLNCV
jgi:hypothetical protein